MFIVVILSVFMLVCSVSPQACVYGVAAILWATAKFRLSPNQKLAVPRKLKRLLLEMAKRTAIERPSIVAAKKVLFFFFCTYTFITTKRQASHTHKAHLSSMAAASFIFLNFHSCPQFQIFK